MAKYDASNPINVWVGNLGKYNEGELVGEWFGLPCDDFEQEWDELMERIGIDGKRYEEVFCADWECDITGMEYSEYPDYEQLNNIAEEWESMHDWEQDAVKVRIELCGEDFDTAVSNMDNVRIWHGCGDMEEVAQEYADEVDLLRDVPDELRYYFDFAMYGRDMQIEGTFCYMPEFGCMVEAY